MATNPDKIIHSRWSRAEPTLSIDLDAKPLPAALLRTAAPISEPEPASRWGWIVLGVSVVFACALGGGYWLSQRGQPPIAAAAVPAPPVAAPIQSAASVAQPAAADPAKPAPAAAAPEAADTTPHYVVGLRPFTGLAPAQTGDLPPAPPREPSPSATGQDQPPSTAPAPAEPTPATAEATPVRPAPIKPARNHVTPHPPAAASTSAGPVRF